MVLMGDGGSAQSLAWSSPAVCAIETATIGTGEGPVPMILQGADRIGIDDLSRETRWPQWSKAMSALGFASALCLRLYRDSDATASGTQTLGALLLYAKHETGFAGRERDAVILARHATVALGGLQRAESLRAAAEDRALIGRAEGLLMERYGIDAEEALSVLRRYSEDSEAGLVETASRLIETRLLPG